jgi:hypothetical protein
VKLLDQEARIEENTQKRAKMKEKCSYIVPRSMVLDRATMRNYLFEENLRNFENKSDPIVPRWMTSSHDASL